MRYLIAIAIGPVQDFINTARRSRDLWFGSWLLSELSSAAAYHFVSQYKMESLIFPAIEDPSDIDPQNPKRDFSVVNRILAIVDTTDATSLMNAVEEAVRDRLTGLRDQAFPAEERFFMKDLAIAQVNDLVEFYWAAVSLRDYAQSRTQVETLLIARKNTRNFVSARQWSGNVPKSSLDGQRESVIAETAYPTRTDDETRKIAKVRHLFERYRARGGERLCGIGLLKRLGNRRGDDSFFSTSHVAALPLMSAVTDPTKVRKYVENLVKIGVNPKDLHGVPLARGPSQAGKAPYPPAFAIPSGWPHHGRAWDGDILFEERLRDYFDITSLTEQERFRRAKLALQGFLKDALPEETTGPLPYFALLHGDGDGMGLVIESLTTPEEHQQLSLRLTQFAKSVAGIVENRHHGSLVYSGGDDVLAFLPLHTVLDCARELADAFRDQKLKGAEGKSATLSVGIAITHHIEPLSDALELAREAERDAKKLTRKNALCIKLSKRSGETTTVLDHWSRLDERLRFFTLLHLTNKLPDGVAYELRVLNDDLKYVPDAALPELKRILKRKRAGHGEEEIDKRIIKKLGVTLDELRAIAGAEKAILRLAEELIVARILAAAREQSFQNPDEAKEECSNELNDLLGNVELGSGNDNADMVD